jgi:hypothetical protein
MKSGDEILLFFESTEDVPIHIMVIGLSALGPFSKRLNVRNDPRLPGFIVRIVGDISEMNSRDVATCMVASRRLEIRDASLWGPLCHHAVVLIEKSPDSFSPRDIANMFNSTAQLKVRSNKLLDALCTVALGKVHDFNEQGIANTLNAMAKFEHKDKALLEALCKAALGKVHGFNEQTIANTLNAMAKFEHKDKALLKALHAAKRTGDRALQTE